MNYHELPKQIQDKILEQYQSGFDSKNIHKL